MFTPCFDGQFTRLVFPLSAVRMDADELLHPLASQAEASLFGRLAAQELFRTSRQRTAPTAAW
jgi:hypothetical protein